ncbi:hypothetical protein C5167_015188 [Papaver somniferum]|uniref:Protein CMSS1 n=1 Tax=Papaver somniferum TaxID=3469 RepID=A0A4Y7J5B7_PAPSO|nr:protein CMSS1-like [Papaver somniferum]RZC56334.1 hypothetical protein C5167_015188 [Papaver somniferum]
MVSAKPSFRKQDQNQNKRSFQNPNKLPLGPNRIKTKKKKKDNEISGTKTKKESKVIASTNLPASQQLSFFLNCFQSSNGIKFSSLELESFKDSCIVKSPVDLKQDADSLHEHMKVAFGKSWKAELCEGKISEGKVEAGNPAVLVISTSALRLLELLRGVRPLTKGCRAAKLFAKHMKVEEQVMMLKTRVNIASGTPSRIKKLIDMDALGLSRLAVIVLDMHTDTKGYSLLTLPQVSNEFWDLYKTHFEQPLIRGDLRICLYGPISCSSEVKTTDEPHDDLL